MRVIELKVEPFEMMSCLAIDCCREINTHGILTVTGMIAAEQAAIYQRKAMTETWVCVKAGTDAQKEIVFFHGILTNFGIRAEGQVHLLTLEIRTGSYLLDLTPHIRSFQEDSFSYQTVVRRCLEETDGDFISSDEADLPVGGFLLQYQETDWEFFRRLASRAGTVLIPEFTTSGKRFYFGSRNNRKAREISASEYVLESGGAGYGQDDRAKKGWVEWAANPIRGICRIRSREVYELGEQVVFMGWTGRIGKVVSKLEGAELVHEYYLIEMSEVPEAFRYNQNLRGLSLKAVVKQVKRDQVQVTIRADENQAFSKNRWFTYATVYSTPDGTGWYCMPEPGDEVRLSFPDNDEQQAYVASSVHLEAGAARSNPDEKSWKNKHNKEILFTPEALILRNNNGLLIELSDHDGIKIISNKGITVEALKEIQITSKSAGVTVSGSSQIDLTQGCAQVSIGDEVNIAGGKVNMN